MAQWQVGETALLQEYVQQGLTNDLIVRRFAEKGISRTYKSIQRKVQQERNKTPELWHAMMPAATVPRFDKPLIVEGDALILGDIHCPCHDAGFINDLIGLALRMGVDQCIVAGDLADFGAFSFFGRDKGMEADEELDALSDFVDRLIACFDRVYYFAGNHDVRPIRALKDAGLTAPTVMRMFAPRPDDKQFFTSDYHWCRLASAGQVFQIEHPKSTSVNATFVPKKLCSKYLCHVIGTHGHNWGETRDPSGRYYAIDSGICADPLRLGYTQVIHNTRPLQVQGAVIVKDGVPLLLNPDKLKIYK